MTNAKISLPGLQIQIADECGEVVQTIAFRDPREEICEEFNRMSPTLTARPADSFESRPLPLVE